MTSSHLEEYKNYITAERRFSEHTVLAYLKDLYDLQDFMQREYDLSSLVDVEPDYIRTWLVYLHENKISPNSVRRKMSSANSYFRYLRKCGFKSMNPAKGLLLPKTKKRLPEFVSKDHMSILLDLERYENDFRGIRDHLVISLLYSTGIRRAELIKLKLRNIDFNKRVISVWGKGDKERLIPVGEKILNILKNYLVLREEMNSGRSESLVLTNKGNPCYPKFIYNIVSKYLSGVPGLNKRSPHVLRHTFATHLADNGADLNAVKSLLGHSNLTATEIYTHNTVESLKKIYGTAFPKAGD